MIRLRSPKKPVEIPACPALLLVSCVNTPARNAICSRWDHRKWGAHNASRIFAMSRSASLLGPAAACALVALVAANPTQNELEVELKNHSVRSGKPDVSTTMSVLRLRVGEPTGYAVFGIDWSQIAQVRYKQQVWTPENFELLRDQLTQASRRSSAEPDQASGDALAESTAASPLRPLWQPPARPAPAESPSRLAQFVELDAVAA